MTRALLLMLLLAACGAPPRLGTLQEASIADTCPTLPPRYGATSSDAPVLRIERGTIAYALRAEASPTTRDLRAVAMERRFAYAVGDGGTLVFRDGGAPWVVESSGTDAALFAVAVAPMEASDYAYRPDDPRPTPAYAVGAAGTILRRDVQGHWTREASGSDADLFAVEALGDVILAVGAHGTVLVRRDGAWSSVNSHVHDDLRAVHEGVLTGGGGAIVQCGFPADAQHPVCVPRRRVASNTVAMVENIGNFHTQLFGDDGSWSQLDLTTGDPSPLPALSFRVRAAASHHWGWEQGKAETLAVGDDGLVALFTADHADAHFLPAKTALTGVAFDDLDGFVVGAGGAILRLQIEGGRDMCAVDL